ncbi:VCBS repeat-containing protein [Streptomyces sp. ME02-8801-2C]|uniref:FG-GAP repeat domain-containing protein n=1 Tax=Streptomyces sp. ME02-8801-2C TaxID=3028680 RepID=UPI0029BDDB89|nr:VCBS repeat-containing protein [Streptomyces sp. ME02-8801-2C]MDX3458146.1 VCBS repeat-containing protein [Streptomyces sp. ME02-8801-2C]
MRGSLAAVTGLALYVSAVPPTASAHAETTAETEVVVPATMRTTPRTARPQSAGASGFLEYRSTAAGRGLWWTTYDGRRKPVEGGDRLEPRTLGYYGTGSDVVALPSLSQNGTGGQVLLRDMGTGTTETVAIPAGQSYLRTYGRIVLTGISTGGERTGLFLLHNENGSTVQQPLTGFPDGAVLDSLPRGTASGLLVTYADADNLSQQAWVDPQTGAVTLLPPGVSNWAAVAGPDYVVSRSSTSTVRVYAAGAFDSPTHEIPFAANAAHKILGVVGDALVVARRDESSVWSVFAVPFDGSGELPLAKRADPEAALVTPDGGLLLAGGESSVDYGIAKIEAGADGLPAMHRIVDLPAVPMGIESLDLSGGQLMTYESGDQATRLYSRSLLANGTLTAGTRTDRGGTGRCGIMAGDYGSCPQLMGTGDGRAVYRTGDGVLRVLDRGESLPGTVFASGLDETQWLGDAAGRYASWKGPTPAGDGLTVTDLDTRQAVLTRAGSAGRVPTALWGEALWTWSADGTATATEVRSGDTVASFRVGGGCGAGDFQAVGRWVYWSGWCDGPQGQVAKAFVYDARSRKLIAAPTGRESRLGDGFLVTRDSTSGALNVTDVTGGSAVSRPLAAAAGKWDVDPYTGLVAYVDPASQDIHVVQSGPTATDIAVIGQKAAPSLHVVGPSSTWSGTWWASKPAESWTLVFRNKATGVIAVIMGENRPRDLLRVAWQGRTPYGNLVPNGTYTWTLTVMPGDRRGAPTTVSGSLKLVGGAAVRHDHVGSDGFGDLLTLTPSGALTFHQGDGAGRFPTKTTATGWPSSITAVPFGDLSGDRCDDVLVRLNSGTLRAYRPVCGKALTTATPYTTLGTGFNQYNVLTSPGDVNGDGRTDLIARQTSTNDVYLYTSTRGGTLSPRVKIAKWSGYKKIIGAGDLNGDGHGDLLAQDTSNRLWRYAGTGTGGFGARVKVADNWGASYNVVVGVGDVTGDGKADLVARDTSGKLWRHNGNGKGSFGPRTAIATGWQDYKALY